MKSATENLSFNQISLSPELTRAIKDMNYTAATSIQASAIPYLLDKQDVIGNSSTGTGKTAAFGIPAVELVNGRLKRPQVLVLSPTRELAMQITTEMKKYCKYKEGVSVAAVYGGDHIREQIAQLRKANIVVGTPGRVMDHLRRKTLKLENIKMVVLDEADEMLSMGFIEDIQTILSSAPEKRQTVLFSATMPPSIIKISEEFLHNPKIINVMPSQNSQADIEQTYYYVSQGQKKDALTLLLKHADANRSIIFCNTKSMVDDLAITLTKQGFIAASLHGDMTQAVRSKVMQNFREGNTRILIATDVAARGIDVDDVDTVINYDIPQSFEYYVHRIGRTGRAGKKGVSQTLVCNGKQLGTLNGLMRYTGSKIHEHSLPSQEDIISGAVVKLAEELMPVINAKPGKVSKQLVSHLLTMGEAEGVTPEQIMYAMAEKITGGDRAYKGIARKHKKEARGKDARKSGSSGSHTKIMVTANVGRNNFVKPNHIVGALTETLDISGNEIGKIDIGPNDTRISMGEETARQLVEMKQPIKINRRDVVFTISRSRQNKNNPRHKSKDVYAGRKSRR